MDQPKVLNPEAALGDQIATAVTYQVTLDGGRTIVMQTYLPRDESIRVYHDALDKLGKAIDRQKARYDLEALRASLELHKKTTKNLQEDYEGIEIRSQAEWQRSGKRGEHRLSPNEAAQKKTAETNIKRYRDEIAKIEVEISKCEGIVNARD